MKHRICAIIILLSLVLSFPIQAMASSTLSLSAKCAVLMEADSKEIVYEKSGSVPCPMASTTKIMTALVVLDSCKLSHRFTVDDSAVGTEGTSAYLQKGDTLTVEAALYALLLQSANDVANALAIEVGGSVEGFAHMMNKKAKELSLNNTCFKNPSGLPEDGHYTTASDLAYIAAVCLENEAFYKIASTKTATVEINGADRTFVNHNKLLSLYDGAVGVKTGFTKESGRCLVGAAERDGVRLISVTLSASNDWNDHRALLDYGFEIYKSYNLCAKDEFIISLPVAGTGNDVLVTAERSEKVTLKKGAVISVRIETLPLIFGPIKKGDAVAHAIFYSEGKELCRVPLTAQTPVG